MIHSCFDNVKARLHRRFLLRQLDAIFVAPKLQLQIARVNQVRFLVQFVTAISQGFRTCLKLVATLARQTLHRVAMTKIACVNGPL